MALTVADRTLTALMFPPPVVRLSGPDTARADRSPPPVETLTRPAVPNIVASPPPVLADTGRAAGARTVASSSQSPRAKWHW
jgi:hypothetical protein